MKLRFLIEKDLQLNYHFVKHYDYVWDYACLVSVRALLDTLILGPFGQLFHYLYIFFSFFTVLFRIDWQLQICQCLNIISSVQLSQRLKPFERLPHKIINAWGEGWYIWKPNQDNETPTKDKVFYLCWLL